MPRPTTSPPCPRPHATHAAPPLALAIARERRPRRRRRPQPQLSGQRDRRPTWPSPSSSSERKEKPSPDNMTLNQHLGELRRRLVICLIAFLVATIVAIILYEPILHFLIRPLCEANGGGTRLPGVTSSNSLAREELRQPLRHLTSGRALPPGQDRRLRWPDPGLARHPLPDLALHHSRPAGPGEEVRHPLRHGRLHPLPARCRHRLPDPPARAGLLAVGGRSRPATDLRSHPVPGPDPGPDGLVWNYLPVSGDTGLLGTGPRRHPGPALTLLAMGGDPHYGRLSRLHAEL